MRGRSILALLGIATAAAFVSSPSNGASSPPAPSASAFVAYGSDLFANTHARMPAFAKASYSCTSCHLQGGTKAHAFTLRGTYAVYPQWNARAKRFITIEDRVAECFLYSMNGKPPAYQSREMIAIVAYIAGLSKGVPVGSRPAGMGTIPVVAALPASAPRGHEVFGQKCAACHGASGQGTPAAPPLFGARAFNSGAGMHRLDTMSAFVRQNMPFGSPPDTLTAQQAVDVTAYVLSQPRPRFQGAAPVIFQPQPARFF